LLIWKIILASNAAPHLFDLFTIAGRLQCGAQLTLSLAHSYWPPRRKRNTLTHIDQKHCLQHRLRTTRTQTALYQELQYPDWGVSGLASNVICHHDLVSSRLCKRVHSYCQLPRQVPNTAATPAACSLCGSDKASAWKGRVKTKRVDCSRVQTINIYVIRHEVSELLDCSRLWEADSARSPLLSRSTPSFLPHPLHNTLHPIFELPLEQQTPSQERDHIKQEQLKFMLQRHHKVRKGTDNAYGTEKTQNAGSRQSCLSARRWVTIM